MGVSAIANLIRALVCVTVGVFPPTVVPVPLRGSRGGSGSSQQQPPLTGVLMTGKGDSVLFAACPAEAATRHDDDY